MPHKSFSVFLAHYATEFVVLLHTIKQGASNQSCGVKKGEKLCKMSIFDFDFLAAKNRTAGFTMQMAQDLHTTIIEQTDILTLEIGSFDS